MYLPVLIDKHMDQPFSHHHNPSGRLLLSVVLNAMITLIEIVGGILSNSLALISDALHNLSDTLSLALAWIANNVGERKPDVRRTFGYKRFEILTAFINASVLSAISIYLIYEAAIRFLHPEPVRSGLMLIIAVTGLMANLVSMLFLHRDSKDRLNVKAVYLHLLGDTLSSIAVIAGAIVIFFFHALWIDPVLTLVISIVIIIQAYRILRESVDILMQSTPAGIDLTEIKDILEKQPLIRNIHHVHCWQLQDHDVLFEAHIETLNDMTLSECNHLREEVGKILKEKYLINHATLQIEYGCCEDTDMIRQKKNN
jgi:cobalt-zinc-cadmium efflux system protein